MSIINCLHVDTIAGVSDDAFRIGVIQYGNKVYTESQLGATHNLRDIISAMLHIKYRNENDNYTHISGALEAGINMLTTQ